MRNTNDYLADPIKLVLPSLFFFVMCLFIGSGLSAGIIKVIGFSPFSELEHSDRQWFRLALLLNNFVLFSVSALLSFWWVYRLNWRKSAGFSGRARQYSLGFSTIFFLLALPLVAWLAWLNLQVSLPEWAVRNEEQTNQFMRSMLTMESLSELLMALLTVAVTPALGEELLLRGLLQRRILQPLLGSHHAAIWLAAFAFSFMHLEFAGFLPRFLLGAVLGYAYAWSCSIWVPILLHFLFNGLQVLAAFHAGGFTPDTEMTIVPPWWLALISLAAVVYVGRKLEVRYFQDKEEDN